MSKVLTPPSLPQLQADVAPAAAPLPPVRPAQQPPSRTPQAPAPAGPRPARAAAPAMWENLRPAPKAPEPKRPDPAEVARAEAEAIVAQARAEGERVQAELAAAARAEARQRGRAEARIDLRRMMREARSLIKEAHAMREAALAALADDVAETAVALAKAVLGRKVAQSSDDLRALVQEVLAEARDPQRLKVNPADAPALSGGSVAIEPDPAITRGGFVLLAADGERDARLEARIARLEAALREGEGK